MQTELKLYSNEMPWDTIKELREAMWEKGKKLQLTISVDEINYNPDAESWIDRDKIEIKGWLLSRNIMDKQSKEVLELRRGIEKLGGKIVNLPTYYVDSGEETFVTFPNGYGARILRSHETEGGDHGLFELHVIRKADTEVGYKETHDTPVTDDVIGWIKPRDLMRHLESVAKLAYAPYWEDLVND